MKLPSVLPSVRKSAIKGGASPAPYIGTALGKGGASIYAPFPAPSGWRWQFLTEDGLRLSDGASENKIVELRRVAA